jgi:hypothetical protein
MPQQAPFSSTAGEKFGLDDAGRLVRRLAREMASLWLFLREQGVEPTNNLAERGLRFGVMGRKTSHGTHSDQGNRWVERTLSLRQTCRQLEHRFSNQADDPMPPPAYGRGHADYG